MIEAVIWCPKCREARFAVKRVPTGQEGVYKHELQKIGSAKDHKSCDTCKTLLERRTDAA